MSKDESKPDQGEPEYRVYRSRRRILPRSKDQGLNEPRRQDPGRRPVEPDRVRPDLPYEVHRRPSTGPVLPRAPREPRRRFRSGRGRRSWLKWLLLAVIGWGLLSLFSFGVSAQLQSMKMSADAKSELGGNPLLLFSPSNILVIGTDSRPPGTMEVDETTGQMAAADERCYEQQARGEVPHDGCPGARADTLMLVRAGGGKFEKLGIPRDSQAEIPGHGTDKINAAYAFGGAGLQVRTVEQFLGVGIDHAVILNFSGFEDFIDAIGGVKVDVPVRLCADISGGKKNGGWTIRLKRGKNTMDGETALAYARTRKPSPCPGPAPSAYQKGYNDLDRAAAQQSIMNGIKNRLTSPWRLPYNFVKGPIIGWTAPKAFVSDMGFLSLPQLALSTVFAGSAKPDVLVPDSLDPMVISEAERERAAARFR